MDNINEKVLEAWIHLIMAVNSERLVSDMPYNEAIICNILYHSQGQTVTATDLCKITKMQKSQMNRTLTSLEKKGIIERCRLESDKREISIKLLDNGTEVYQAVHQSNIDLVANILERIGKDRAQEIIDLFSLITSIAKDEIK